jgi:hypothetical protein
MRSTSMLPSLLALACATTTLAAALPAHALTCGKVAPGGYYPTGDATIAADEDVVLLCNLMSGPPCTAPAPWLDPDGVEVELLEVHRRTVDNLADPDRPMTLVRYRPRDGFQPGVTYRQMGGGDLQITESAQAEAPLPPRIRSLSYEVGPGFSGLVFVAAFDLDPHDGMLVADVGEPDDDPWQSVTFEDVPRDVTDNTVLQYRLGIDQCMSTFAAADYGVHTQVRFGTLDGHGRFSGWTRTYEVAYPASEHADAGVTVFPDGGVAVDTGAASSADAGVSAPVDASLEPLAAEPQPPATRISVDDGCTLASSVQRGNSASSAALIVLTAAALRRRRLALR